MATMTSARLTGRRITARRLYRKRKQADSQQVLGFCTKTIFPPVDLKNVFCFYRLCRSMLYCQIDFVRKLFEYACMLSISHNWKLYLNRDSIP